MESPGAEMDVEPGTLITPAPRVVPTSSTVCICPGKTPLTPPPNYLCTKENAFHVTCLQSIFLVRGGGVWDQKTIVLSNNAFSVCNTVLVTLKGPPQAVE